MYRDANNKRTRGFTLIELLVVVAIIGMLSSIVLASLNTARAKSRDAKRQSDLHSLQVALELYHSMNGAYPLSGGTWRGNCSSWGGYGTTGSTGYIPSLAPTQISVLPLDPKPIAPSSCYIYYSDGVNYKAMAYHTMEVSPNSMRCPAFCSTATYPWCASDSSNTSWVASDGFTCY